ncbi:hypothetical protein JHD49_01755 [Sulfurimonas sp. SAG-AH-194-C21]|nr:hypothetical protein [Sulfurimonas sp. SAG-AH-194-C21]MDF1882660.1 hypothetical protein [Sulfurimonas sp. SAG-AH-194-C21]
MFVSSYSTYIDTSVTKKLQNDKVAVPLKKTESFASKLLQTTQKNVLLNSKIPLNYISNYKALSNRQLLDEQTNKQTVISQKFSKLSAMSSSKVSYEENSKMFSFLIKPKTTLSQTPKLDKNLPTKAQESQESFMKVKMVDIYTANDNYYRVTAA